VSYLFSDWFGLKSLARPHAWRAATANKNHLAGHLSNEVMMTTIAPNPKRAAFTIMPRIARARGWTPQGGDGPPGGTAGRRFQRRNLLKRRDLLGDIASGTGRIMRLPRQALPSFRITSGVTK